MDESFRQVVVRGYQVVVRGYRDFLEWCMEVVGALWAIFVGLLVLGVVINLFLFWEELGLDDEYDRIAGNVSSIFSYVGSAYRYLGSAYRDVFPKKYWTCSLTGGESILVEEEPSGDWLISTEGERYPQSRVMSCTNPPEE